LRRRKRCTNVAVAEGAIKTKNHHLIDDFCVNFVNRLTIFNQHRKTETTPTVFQNAVRAVNYRTDIGYKSAQAGGKLNADKEN